MFDYKSEKQGRGGGYGGRSDYGGHGGGGDYGGREGRHGGGMADALLKDSDTQLLFVGSVNCIRHKPYMEIGRLMQEGRASLLCPSMSDFSSGRYLTQVVDAIAEVSAERGAKKFVLACGCQWVILSTDGDMIIKRLKDDFGIELEIFQDDHLEFGDHE